MAFCVGAAPPRRACPAAPRWARALHPSSVMTDHSIDEYARKREPHDEDRSARDDTGRPIDHRATPGAFEQTPAGPTIPSMEVGPEDAGLPEQTDAIHRAPPERDPALAYPAPEHEPMNTSTDPERAKRSLREAAAERTGDLSERARTTGWIRSAVRAVIDFNRATADRLEAWLSPS